MRRQSTRQRDGRLERKVSYDPGNEMKGLAAANYIWSQRILAAVKSNSKGKTWAAIALALIGALIAWFVPKDAEKSLPVRPEPAAAKHAATATAHATFDF